MAKHRPQTKAKSKTRKVKTTTAGASAPPAEVEKLTPRPAQQQSSASPRRSTYFEAVAVYERGIASLQKHDYSKAVELFQSVLRLYPEERELLERVRLYLNVCKRHITPREDVPQTLEERLYAATLAINGGRYDEAISHLRLVRDEDPDNDHALYMLAVAHAQRAEHAEAIAHLERAIALNSENRALARKDPDLDALRDDDAFRTALDTPSAARADRSFRRPFKPKSAR